jgi:dihydroorotate dehydrogenase (fumarate)
MAELKTQYMGVGLKNPILAGASDLSATLDGVRRLEDAGVGGIVLKSLFEEEIQLEHFKYDEDMDKEDNRHPEMITVFPHALSFGGPQEFLSFVRKAKEAVGIPVFASLNAVEHKSWVEYAKMLAQCGVDGLELNFFAVPADPALSSGAIEQSQRDIVSQIRSVVALPLAAKLSVQYANPLHQFVMLEEAGINGLVLFNRFFQPDIDVEQEQNNYPFNLSQPIDNRVALRYMGLGYGQLRASLCGNTGIFSGEDVVRNILVGAQCVQVVSTLYRHGTAQVPRMLKELGEWMDRKGYGALDDFRGSLSRKNSNDPWQYTRSQYARLLMNPKKVFENAPTL